MKRKYLKYALMIGISFVIHINPSVLFAANGNLHKNSKGIEVVHLQDSLRKIGMFKAKSTGYFGKVTHESVKKFQKKFGLRVDGIVGRQTKALLASLTTKKTTIMSSRGEFDRTDLLVPWYGDGEKIFKIGKNATVYDIETSLSFDIIRTYGYNHADCETITSKDTKTLMKIYGGKWSWERRAIILNVDGISIAASMTGMPHAGLEDEDTNKNVDNRSGGYGTGTNLDKIKGNNMDGHFDIHLLNSRTHGTNVVDAKHQQMIKKAAQWASQN